MQGRNTQGSDNLAELSRLAECPALANYIELDSTDEAAIAKTGSSNPLTRTGVTTLTSAVTPKLKHNAMNPAFRPW